MSRKFRFLGVVRRVGAPHCRLALSALLLCGSAWGDNCPHFDPNNPSAYRDIDLKNCPDKYCPSATYAGKIGADPNTIHADIAVLNAQGDVKWHWQKSLGPGCRKISPTKVECPSVGTYPDFFGIDLTFPAPDGTPVSSAAKVAIGNDKPLTDFSEPSPMGITVEDSTGAKCRRNYTFHITPDAGGWGN